MTTPTFTTPPATPARSDSDADFVTKADAFVAWMATFWAEMVAAVTWLATTAATATSNAASAAVSALTATNASAVAASATGYFDTCATSLAIGTGAKAITIDNTGKLFANNDDVYLVRRGDPNARMHGIVSLANMGAKTMTITVAGGGFAGSGTYTDWFVVHADLLPLVAATAAQLLAATSTVVAITPAALVTSAAFQTLTDAASIAWDMALGFSAKVTITANRAMAAPSNLADGLTYSLYVKQDGTGSRTLTWNSIFDWGAAGAPTLSTGAGKVDQCFGQYSADTGKIHMNFRRAA